MVVGKDKRLSTSKLQSLLWTYTLAGMLLAIIIAKWIGAEDSYTALIDKGLPEEYLILLGGPFAAAVASKAIVTSKVTNGTLTKTSGKEKASATDRLGEAFSNDQGDTDLVDTQYLLFNLVALVYVIGGFIDDPSSGLPSIPAVLVGLTSVSAATYVSNKAVQRDTPVLTGLAPGRGGAGDALRVFGQNLLIPVSGTDAPYQELFVLFDGSEATILGVTSSDGELATGAAPGAGQPDHRPRHGASGDDRLFVEVPTGLQAGQVKVTVRNWKGVASEQADFEVQA